MTDIVERLRVRRNPMLDGEREEAAAEIERLRGLLAAIFEADATFQGGAVLGARLEALAREALGENYD